MAFDKQARLNQIREQRKASNLAQRERIKQGVERLRAARLSRAKGMASGGDVMDDKMGRAMARGMKAGGDVKKMQAGGMAERRAARDAAMSARRTSFDERMAAKRAARDAAKTPSAVRTAKRQATDARIAANRKAMDERVAAQRSKFDQRKAASAAHKERMAAARARRGMKSGGDVKKYAEGGSIYRKAADGVAKKGRTHTTMVKMARGGKC